MASFSNNILDIPGLMPVNIGSSSAYPVPFAPQIRPPQSAPVAAPQVSPQSGPAPAGAPASAMQNISGFSGPGNDGTSPTLGGGIGQTGIGDAQFAMFGNSYGGGSPDFFNYANYAPDIQPAQLSRYGNVGIGDYGQGVFDRIGSLGNTPTIRNDNLTQGAINAAGMFVPGVGPLAGILQGFNLLDGGMPTGNALADMALTPGVSQSLFANAANWLNRQFGGEYMPYDQGVHIAQSPEFQQAMHGIIGPFNSPLGYIDGVASDSGVTPATPSSNQAAQQGSGGGPTDYAPDPYSMMGNMWDSFMPGATFGGGRFDNASNPFSSSWGGGGGGAYDWSFTADNNGGHGQ